MSVPSATDCGRRIAVVGAGAAGLGASWLLARAGYAVHLFEAEPRAGGHANTVDLPIPGASSSAFIPVDIGFIVYNTRTYPDIVSLFELLAVEEENSSMSFACSLQNPTGKLFEWGSDNLATLFADRANLYRPSMYTMLLEMRRFNAAVYDFVAAVEADPNFSLRDISLGEFLQRGAYSTIFTRSYLVPMVSAVWSASFNSALTFPARSLFHFFVNHGLAQVFARPQWRTPAKRSRDYVNRLLDDFRAHGGMLHLSSPVRSVARDVDGVTIHAHGHDPLRFEQVIFGTHAPDTLRILADEATDDEVRILSAFKYASNRAYVHHDPRLMPHNRTVWSSWNFISRNVDSRKSGAEKNREENSSGVKGACFDTDTDVPGTKVSGDDQPTVQSAASDGGSPNTNGDPPSVPNGDASAEPEEVRGFDAESADVGTAPAVGHTMSDCIDGHVDLSFPKRTVADTTALPSEDPDDIPVCVSYWLNRLQNYHKFHMTVPELFLTLNPVVPIEEDKVLLELTFDHPQFTEEAVNAQPLLQRVIQGQNRTWFCGAYARFGFHEDAIMTGLDVAERLTNYTVLRPWKAKNYLAINDNSRKYELPYSALRGPVTAFLIGLLVINMVMSRLQEGLGKLAKRMTDRDPSVVVASGDGRLHRFGPPTRRQRSHSFFAHATEGFDVTVELPPPTSARISVRSPRVLARIADALRQGSELAPIAAACFAAGEVDCPSPSDLSETLRAFFIADGLDIDFTQARRGRAMFAENVLFAIVGNFEEIRTLPCDTRLPELSTCVSNVVCPSWWLSVDEPEEAIEDEMPRLPLGSSVSPHDLLKCRNVIEVLGDLSTVTVSLLRACSENRVTIIVKTTERSNFVRRKADLLLVSKQVTVVKLDDFVQGRGTGFGRLKDIDDDAEGFDLVLCPGLLNNFKANGFKSVDSVFCFLKGLASFEAVIEIGVTVLGKRGKGRLRKASGRDSLFCGDDGYQLLETSNVLRVAEKHEIDLQRLTMMDHEAAAMDVYEVIQRVFNSLAVDKLEPSETRAVLAQMCLWQAALHVKYVRRLAMSFKVT